jgi:hypothetical protein
MSKENLMFENKVNSIFSVFMPHIDDNGTKKKNPQRKMKNFQKHEVRQTV